MGPGSIAVFGAEEKKRRGGGRVKEEKIGKSEVYEPCLLKS